MPPKVSVILPVYNGERYLKECLDSILAQTFKDFELLCVNDGSTDSTNSILEIYAAWDSRIQILNQENSGYGCAMNYGMRMAKGDYIAVVESDDYVTADMLQTLYYAAQVQQLDVVKADFYSFTGDGNQREFTYMQTALDKRFYGPVFDSTQTPALFYPVQMTWMGLYRRSFLLEHDIWHNESPGAAFQDNGFWFQVFAWAKRVSFVNQAVYCYRVDNMAASTKQSDVKKLNQMFGEYDFILAFLERNPSLKERLYTTYLHFRLDNILCRFFFGSPEGRQEIAISIQAEVRKAASCKDFSWDSYGTRLRTYLWDITEDPLAFAANPPESIGALCWQEVADRPFADTINPDLTTPAWLISDFLDTVTS